MKARDIIGRRVARVVQERVFASGREWDWHLESIVFTDGAVLNLTPFELESADGYGIHGAVYHKPTRKRAKADAR